MSKQATVHRTVKSTLENIEFDPQFPLIQDLRVKARKRIPGFAYNYLAGGCNEENNLFDNTNDLRSIHLKPYYLRHYPGAELNAELFDQRYSVPFGIAPVGLQGMMWPNSPVILARAASKHNIPFILSTVSTSSIEEVGEMTEGRMWFQLYHPASDDLRDDLLQRAKDVGVKHLVVTADVPTFGYRPREFKSRLAMPPKMTLKNIMQVLSRPMWAMTTLRHGRPYFATVAKYMPVGMSMKQLGVFMKENFDGRMNPDKLAALRDKWSDKIILKGLASEEDAELCVKLGFDGIIISNHGGRQLDAGESSINALRRLVPKVGHEITLMVDGGFRSGPDVAKALAIGAKFVFMGRPFMYGVAAMGSKGGNHTISILKLQFQQVMEQLGCTTHKDLHEHLIRES